MQLTSYSLFLQVIHDEAVIHNDLKPENFVCIGARLKLIDFGIANRIETEKTSIERDIRCGTINYMAPETIEANDLDRFKVSQSLKENKHSSEETICEPFGHLVRKKSVSLSE